MELQTCGTGAGLHIIEALEMPTTLDKIVNATRVRVTAAKRDVPLPTLEKQAREHTPRGFGRALRTASQKGVAVIAELKKASPSKGLIRGSFHPASLGLDLVRGGATALSVLTEEQHFLGSLDYLLEVSAAVEVPLLRKDFIVDEYQLLEARAYCADAVLLIVAALNELELRQLRKSAGALGLDVLCEVHDEQELQTALDAECEIIGVNNRNLRTFEVDLNTSLNLAAKIPADCLRVAESGMNSPDDIAVLRRVGYHAFLIGESLMRADHPGQALSELIEQSTVAR
jgi:indole-3-glycerol phosphate synthase